MPYPNEHSCRLLDPDQFVRFFRKHVKDDKDVGDYKATGKAYDLIIGYREDESSDTQAHRYPKDTWTEAQARKHCKAHDGKSFEPAKEEKSRTTPPPGIKVPEGFQRRSFPLRELRVEPGPDNQRKIVGYAAVFDVLSEPLWGFREKIRKGAFTKTIGEADIRALFNHDENYVLGRNTAGTLKLWEDDTGLGIEILTPDTQWARDLIVTMERGDVDQMSFSFRVVREEWTHTPVEEIRTLIEVEARDVSPVTFPAYTQTIAQVRSVFGVEVRTVGEALSRLEAGSMTEADLQLLKRLLSDIHGRLAAAPGPAAHPAEGPQDQPNALANLRRQLELDE
jgi:HK97 family phage prohead protease